MIIRHAILNLNIILRGNFRHSTFVIQNYTVKNNIVKTVRYFFHVR
jgi:hypothetical protein